MLMPIEFYLQKAMPTVFDDSLSYYEAIGKLMAKCNEIIEEINGLSAQWSTLLEENLKQANNYTDTKLSEYNQQFQNVISQLNAQYAAFNAQVTSELNQFDTRLKNQEQKQQADVVQLRNEISLSIEDNNQYIFDQIASELIGMKVINYFTGEKISVQEMFDYLAQFHLQGAITYNNMADVGKTFNGLAALNMTYSQLAINGRNIYK